MAVQARARILTIDDDSIVRSSMAVYLEDCGYEVLQADNGLSGLALFRSAQPDIVLVDLQMPECNGLEVLAALADEAPDVPAVVVSGTGALQDAIEALRRGAWDYLSKPVYDLKLLEHRVEQALEKARIRKELRLHQEHLESEVQKRTLELEAARNEAETASRVKSDFLANMSHELRTPLNGILGLTELLMLSAPDTNAEQRENLGMVRQAGSELLTIVNNLLDMSKIEAGNLVLREHAFCLRETIEDVVQIMDVQARWKNIYLDLIFENALPDTVIGDGARLKQVLHNLIMNAIKHTEQGGVRVRVALLSAEGDQFALRVVITDTGTGIIAEKLASIFEPFALGESLMTKRHSGLGLGLAISREVVQQMHGDITVSSREGEGSEFVVTCMLGRPGDAAHSAGQDAQPQDMCMLMPPLRILIVEDDVVNRKLAQYFCEKQGHAVAYAASGLAALDLLAREPFDLILMDIEIPEMDGIETTQAIRNARSAEIAADIPVIAMTVHAMKGDRERFLAAGMNEHIVKPVDFNELARAIETVMNE